MNEESISFTVLSSANPSARGFAGVVFFLSISRTLHHRFNCLLTKSVPLSVMRTFDGPNDENNLSVKPFSTTSAVLF